MKKAAQKATRMNSRWHAAHRMPMGATLDQRVKWHLAHAENCACRPIPVTVVAELKRRPQLGR
jgi:hypothetical protein